MDFFMIATRSTRNGLEIYPKFILGKSEDLMIRGGDFYAVWDEKKNLWSTNEEDALRIIDDALDEYANKKRQTEEVRVLHMWDAESGMIDRWHKYCQKQCRDSFTMLDEKIIFSNTETAKKDFASKRLNYPLEKGNYPAYEKIISTLYNEEERKKIEWAIGSIVTGDSKELQKFMVFYGSAGTGKSTILNIIQQLFDGYYSVFDAKALGSSTSAFALEAFKNNPLVAIQHDGDLSRIEDNTRLNSLVSHELMTVNEKFKSTYSNRFKCFLFMGTNKPVKITDGKSGLIRRLIDVSPSGNLLNTNEYKQCIAQIPFELGAIAWHCKEVYLNNKKIYDNYIPKNMMGASNDFYNFVIDSYHIFKRDNQCTLKASWEMYKTYCDEAKVPYPLTKRAFKEELKNYFYEYEEKFNMDDGSKVTGYYYGFKTKIFEKDMVVKNDTCEKSWLEFKSQKSIFDADAAEYPAQYANENETPTKSWDKIKTKLGDIDTSKLHYVNVPENHIVIDFDIKDENGEKSFEKNLEAASKWPATYAELSKSGAGIHLHYLYSGDVSKLSRVYDENIEVKIFNGNSTLRRKVTKCNNIPIACINSGLPYKETKMIDNNIIQNEKGLRTTIKKCLAKEIHPGTKSNVDFINKILEDAYSNGVHYDVSDMANDIIAFAADSTNNSEYCLKLASNMHFASKDCSEPIEDTEAELVFYDIEVFPNLFLVNYKLRGEGNPVIRMINPSSSDIENLLKYNLIGFNCRRYDNHLIYARLMGYTNEQLYNLSQKIISGEGGFFSEAYNISYTDVYDFASAGNKKSLKKLEIEMGIHHQELGLPWDKPVPEEMWTKVAEYCDNDVIATEAAFDYLSADWTARQILADLAEMPVNTTTNTLTTRIIFGKNRNPQNQFEYRNLAESVKYLKPEVKNFLTDACPKMMAKPHGKDNSLLPYFPGYKFEFGKSTYRDEEVSEGGYVYAEPGMHVFTALLDIASMHPHSTIAECLFGVKYTTAYRDIVEGRVDIKHEAWEEVNHILDGKLTKFIQIVIDGKMTSKQLANALKTAINSVYGLTSASFENPFNDPRNKDNIVAKRGALFMIDLKHEVQKRGFTVAHIKTDSIKIPNATPEIINFVMEFGERYGYTFEHEATYERMCLVNNAVYIAKYMDPEECQKLYGYVPGDNKKHGGEWTATGKQFAVPYVYKTLFSHEKIEFEDMCETFSVSKGDIYLDTNENLPDVSKYEKELEKLESDYKKGKLSDITFENMCEGLPEKIDEGHDLQFIGRVGQFTPILPGNGGGVMYRVYNDKKYATSGSTGYRWLESEKAKQLGDAVVDRSFYNKLVDDAIEAISKYGDYEWFVSDDKPTPNELILAPYMNIPENANEEGLPFL